jgi:hypothetical protein
MSPDQFRQAVSTQLKTLRESRFVRDRIFIGSIGFVLLMLLAMWGLLIIRVHPTSFQVPVHYTTFGGFDSLGAWYQPYEAGIYATVLIAADLVLAYLSYHRSRLGSFFLLAGAAVVALFSLIIANAFSSLV